MKNENEIKHFFLIFMDTNTNLLIIKKVNLKHVLFFWITQETSKAIRFWIKDHLDPKGHLSIW